MTETKRKAIARVEYYHDRDPEHPSAYQRYHLMLRERDHSKFGTVILDSFSSALRAARWTEQFVNNPDAVGKSQMKWWGESGDRLERSVAGPFKHMPTSAVVVGHIGTKADNIRDTMLYGVEASGRLSHSLPREFGEVYALDVSEDREGNLYYSIQTAKSGRLMAKTHLGLPPLFEVPYGKGYQALVGSCSKPALVNGQAFISPLKCLVYGDSGAGKSLFAASFPKPLMVYCFDGFDNALPYLELGEPGELRELEDNMPNDRVGGRTTYQMVYRREPQEK